MTDKLNLLIYNNLLDFKQNSVTEYITWLLTKVTILNQNNI